jgi:hypothetical protein
MNIEVGLSGLAPAPKNLAFGPWFNIDKGQDRMIRFLTDGDRVVHVASHEYALSQDGRRRTFVCPDADRHCLLCARNAPREKTGWAYVHAGKLKRGMFHPDGEGAYVLKMSTERFWSQAREAFDELGTLCDRPFTVRRANYGQDVLLTPSDDGPEAGWIAEEWPDVGDLSALVSYYASEEFFERYLGNEEDSDA